MARSPKIGQLFYTVCRFVLPSEEFFPFVSPSAPLMPLAGVSESRLKSKLFALRFLPNLTHSGSSRPSWLFERRVCRSLRGMSPGSPSAFRCSFLPQASVRSSGVRWGAPNQDILRWFDSVPLLHLASASETPTAFLVIHFGLRLHFSPAFLELLRPLPRSPLSGLRPPFPLLSQ